MFGADFMNCGDGARARSDFFAIPCASFSGGDGDSGVHIFFNTSSLVASLVLSRCGESEMKQFGEEMASFHDLHAILKSSFSRFDVDIKGEFTF